MIASIRAKLEAEQAVLGCVLLDEKHAGEVVGRLMPEDFCDANRPVYYAVRKLFGSGEHIDPVTVMGCLPPEYGQILGRMMDLTPSAVNCGVYIAQLIQQAALLRVQALAQDFSTRADSDALPELMAAISDATGQAQHIARFTAKQRWEQFVYRQIEEPEPYLTWNMPGLDNVVKAKQRGSVVIVAARPSAGKTALCIQFADHIAKTARVGFYSLETDAGTLTDRQLAMRYGVQYEQIQGHSVPEQAWGTMLSRSEMFSSKNFDVIEAAGWSAAEIESDAVGHGYDVIFIDYLQLCRRQRGEKEYDAVTRTSQELHTMAVRRGISVIAACQLSRPEKGGYKEPSMDDLRSSGQIEQDANVVMLLYNDPSDGGEATRRLKLAKNKDGRKGGKLALKFEGDIQRFVIDWVAMNRSRPAKHPQQKPVPQRGGFHELPTGSPTPFDDSPPQKTENYSQEKLKI